MTRADFGSTTSQGFTAQQLYSTASYKAKNLGGIGLAENQMTRWNFKGQNLTDANLGNSRLSSAKFAGANLSDADLRGATGPRSVPPRSTTPSCPPARLTVFRWPRANIGGAKLPRASMWPARRRSTPMPRWKCGSTAIPGVRPSPSLLIRPWSLTATGAERLVVA